MGWARTHQGKIRENPALGRGNGTPGNDVIWAGKADYFQVVGNVTRGKPSRRCTEMWQPFPALRNAPNLTEEWVEMPLDAIHRRPYLGQSRCMPGGEFVQRVQGPSRLAGIAQLIDGVHEFLLVVGPHV